MWQEFDAWVQEQGAPPLDDLEFIHTSPAANLYVYPEEADYVDRRALDSTWHRMDSSVRETVDDYELPAEVRDRPEGTGLVYLSLGSLGGADVDLMNRLVSRLNRAAATVCPSYPTGGSHVSAGAAACRQKAIRQAVADIGSAELTARLDPVRAFPLASR